MEKNREGNADLLRVFASLLVVLLHVSAVYGDSGWGIVYNGVSRCAVPLFVMLSGRYLLAQPPSVRRMGKKSLRLFGVMVLWAAAYFAVELLRGTHSWQGAGDFAAYLVTQPVHLWYLWAAIALYLFTPCLAVFCQNAPRKIVDYALALAFLFGSVVTILLRTQRFPLLAQVVDQMKMDATLGFLFCYLAGWRLRRFSPARRRKAALLLLGGLGLAATWAGALAFRGTGTASLFLSFYAPNVLLTALGGYVLFDGFCPGPRWAWLEKRAGSTMGVYLVHILVLWVLGDALAPLAQRFPLGLVIPAETLLVFLASLALAEGWRWGARVLRRRETS